MSHETIGRFRLYSDARANETRRSRAFARAHVVVLTAAAAIGCERGGGQAGSAPSQTAPPPEPPAATNAAAASEANPAETGSEPSTGSAPVAVACEAAETRMRPGRDPSGRRHETRIVGGRPSDQGLWPWAVALAFERQGKLVQYCGGSLIAPNWVLTAAHCEVLASDKAIIGRGDLNGTDGEVVDVELVKNHARYDSDMNDNDVAVVKLQKSLQAPTVQLIAGASDSPGSVATVVGWGAFSEGSPTSPVLQQVEVPIVDNAGCQAGYAGTTVHITGNMLCAGLSQGGKDSCQGDSGGPLVVKGSGGNWQQAGIVSFGIGCARPNRYGVYTRVSKYVPWIKACTSEGS